jgi:hypothetical protein
LVEQLIRNEKVEGSTPFSGTISSLRIKGLKKDETALEAVFLYGFIGG